MTPKTAFLEPSVSTDPASARPCIHAVFEAQARKSPGAVALSCGAEKLTYQQLNERANRLAHHLRKLGVGAETPVALYLDRSVNMVVAILGVLKAGGAYVPIDLAYPKDRLEFMLEDAQAPVVVTEMRLRDQIAIGTSRSIVCLDSDWDGIATETSDNLSTVTTSENAAYIIYTSGSTGKPKGVVVTHHNVVRLLKETEHWYGFNAEDVWPLFHSYAFDVSVWELWGSLFYGGRLVIVPYLVTRSPNEFYDLLACEKVTVLNQTPSAFRQLIWAEETAPVKHELCLRYVICAGEALELQSLKPWFDRHGDQKPQIVNKYGITETTVHSTYRVIRKTDLTNGMGSVIGVPIPDLQIYLVDEDLKPVPPGVPGEICVGGEGVARGYLNRPQLTRKRFLPDSFSSQAGARMYRSGDLAQINAKGELEYLGRMDHQVKIRGFRVELGEIESTLNKHATIRESVVIAQDDGAGGKRLVAYVVPAPDTQRQSSAAEGLHAGTMSQVAEVPPPTPSVTELREYLTKTLPDYMVPAAFVFLDSFPLTTNGKIDRRALPSPGSQRPNVKTQFVAPRNPTEEKLVKIWREVLGIGTIGVHDNLFELGGDSIRSISILARAQQHGWRLSLEQLFRTPTVAGLATCAESAATQSSFKPAEPFSLISAEDRAKLPPDLENAYPVARLQMGMFYHNELNPLSAMYHDVFSYRVDAVFDREKLQQSIYRLAGRHLLLRTSFQLAGFSQPLQVVRREVQPPFSVEDLRPLSPKQQQERTLDWIETEKRRAFDRSAAPLFRFHTQILGDNSFQFFISFHHSCLDGWSLAAIVTEIFRDYRALTAGQEQNIPAPQVSYADFVALEQQTICSGNSRAFWTEKLKEAPSATVPRWPKSFCPGGHEQVRGPEILIDEKTLAGVKALANTAGVPLKSVLLATHLRVMSFIYAQDDVVTGLISNGRPEELDGEKLIGLFLNTLPLRLQLESGTWLDLVKQTFTEEQQLMPHRRMPLSEIQKLTGKQQLFETAFDYVHFHVLNQLDSGKVRVTEGPYFEANNLTTYTTFILDPTATRLEIHIDYDPNAIAPEQIQQITKYYVATLQAMASDPNGSYEAFLPFSETERRQILVEWNATQEDYPHELCIHQLFEQRARENPKAVALVCQNEQLTYAQLNQRAEALAEHLQSLNLGHEELVGVCVERSPEMLVALLAILKAGGAYVPLDPTYPAERLAFMLQDSNLRLLLTQQHLVDSLPKAGAQEICIETIKSQRDRTGAERRVITRADEKAKAGSRAPSSRLAYVIFTSGSTGKPKGVQVTHQAVVNLLTSAGRKIGFTPGDNLLAVTTLSFDIAGLELFLPLIKGARLTLATREQASDGTQLGVLLESSGATVMQATPATWRLLIESGWPGNKNMRILCGGEALNRALADELLDRSREVWNFYGPTETTIWSTAWKVVPSEPISIGRPLGNTRTYILDQHLRPVPPGAIGELHIGGDGIARGYLNRAQLTAQKFIPDLFAPGVPQPASTAPSNRVYKTGDLARYRPDGNIECIGRTDHQVKIRGFRIELGEIETALRQHAGIAQAVVTAHDDPLGEKRLVGYIISRNGPPSAAELRDFLKTKLPGYMVPAHFVPLEEFPLTPNGKIDVGRLPAPETAAAPGRNYMPPQSAEEQALAAIWSEALALKQIGTEDNFFDLGGDSLSATRVFARINRSFGTGLTLREILEHPTLGSLAELVVKNKGTTTTRPAIIPRRARVTRTV